jgi:peptidoglycan/LPS O-acetylase OafA/YrhL
MFPFLRWPLQARTVSPEALRERWLLLAVLLLALLALTGPVVLQAANYHDFADQQAWSSLPHAMDVLSNLPFALWGLAGAGTLVQAHRLREVDRTAGGLAALFFCGLLVTAAVSAMYHWQPDDAGLVWDRTGMVLAFAGLLGLAAWQRISSRAAWALAAIVLVAGPLTVQVWSISGNLLPWGVLQFGGMALIVGLACLPPLPLEAGRTHSSLSIRWSLVIALYALAKVFELGDHLVFEWTGHFISGHSLKHIVASCAAWPVVAALKDVTKSRAESGSPPRGQQAARVRAA